jgi:hypothetical protein
VDAEQYGEQVSDGEAEGAPAPTAITSRPSASCRVTAVGTVEPSRAAAVRAFLVTGVGLPGLAAL